MSKTNLIQIKEVIPDTHIFIYKDKKYPFKFDYFKYASKYFNKNQKELERIKTIFLVDSKTEENSTISKEAIEDFINFVQSKKIIVNKENVFHLNYLSNKYEVPTLLEKTNEYILNNQKDLALKMIIQKQEEFDFDTTAYEKMIATNIDDFIDDDLLLDVKIPILYRILHQVKINGIKSDKKLNDFLLKCIDKYGRKASILFENVCFDKTAKELLKRLMRDYANIFDFSYIKSAMIEVLCEYEEIISLKTIENNEMQKQLDSIKKEKEKIQQELEQKKVEIINHQKEKDEKEKSLLSKTSEISQLKDEKEKIKQEKEKLQLEIQKKEIDFMKTSEEQNKIINQQKEEIKLLECPKSFIPLFYDQNKEFNGIIKYLTDKTGGNIHDNGTIEVTANSQHIKHEPKNLLDQNDTIYMSEQDNSQICFDFKKRKVKIINYSIKSNENGQNTGHLKSWNIEVSNDGKKWIKIDEQKNCPTLNGSYFTGTFKVDLNNFSRYVRLNQTDSTWGGGYYLFFNYIEFYGYLEDE